MFVSNWRYKSSTADTNKEAGEYLFNINAKIKMKGAWALRDATEM